MGLEQGLADAEHENTRLKVDNEMPLDVTAQMEITSNHLINRYMMDDSLESA